MRKKKYGAFSLYLLFLVGTKLQNDVAITKIWFNTYLLPNQ